MKLRALTFIVALALMLPQQALGKSRSSGVNKQYFKLSGLAYSKMDSDIGLEPQPNSATVLAILNRELSFETGTGFTAAYGFQTDKHLNTEIEFTGRWESLDQLHTPAGDFPATGDLRSFSFMLNIPWMFHNRTRLTPYAGAGIGMNWQRGDLAALADGSAPASKGEQLTVAYQILAGVGYALNRSWELVLGYRFFGTIDAALGQLQLQNKSHNIELGVRWYLPEKIKRSPKVKKKRRRKSSKSSKTSPKRKSQR